MNATFEDRLLQELKREVVLRAAEAEFAAPARGRLVTPRRVGFALAACGVAAAAVVAVPGSGSTPAYAVEKNSNGTITFTLEDVRLSGAEQQKLVKELEAAGVHTQVNKVPSGMRCADPAGAPVNNQIIGMDPGPDAPKDTQKPSAWHRTLHEGETVRIDNYPRGVAYTFLKGKVSPCKLESNA